MVRLYTSIICFGFLITQYNAFYISSHNRFKDVERLQINRGLSFSRFDRNKILALYSKVTDINDWIATQAPGKDDLKVMIQENPDGSLSSYARVGLKKGEAMVTLPLGLCLDLPKSVAKFGDLTTKLRTGEFGMLALLLLAEKGLGKSSKYVAYVESLPEVSPGILSWNANSIEELVSSTTRDVQSQLSAINSDWESVVSKLKSPSLPLELQTIDWFKWAMGIVKSRSVFIDGRTVLMPGMDFIEFDPFSTADPMVGSAGPFGGKVAKVLAERSYGPNEKVVMSYGLKSSAECLEDHGIVPDITLVDSCCEIKLTIDGTEKYPDDKIDILERAGYG